MAERGKRLTVEFIQAIRETVRREIARYLNEKPVRQRWFNTSRRPSGKVELSHGVIIAVCNEGCSTYRVQRVHRRLKAGCDDCGSGSAS